ncbi:MAG: enoyl-CoA hydratase/isomerase family protein, partial [Polymorphobacter sp.]
RTPALPRHHRRAQRKMTPLGRSALAALVAAHPRLDDFGPGSAHPALVVEAAAITPGAADWLRRLPCPVIATGAATPEQAHGCDVITADPAPLLRNIARWPIAAMVLVQHLRAAEPLGLAATLTAESLAYATLQQGPEFRRWQAGAPPLPLLVTPDEPLAITHHGDTLHITLADPANRNAIGTAMRDALCEALDTAIAIGAPVHIAAQGRAFSTGGAVSEFGQASDPATAHWVRSLRLPATRLAALAPHLTVHVQGAAIGAGAEIAAFANRLTATPNAWFQLPELRYGLIPGAGGTASLPARIGRHRTAWMALSMARVPARMALEWGFVDAIAG